MSTINTVFNTINTKIFLNYVNDQGQTISFKAIQKAQAVTALVVLPSY